MQTIAGQFRAAGYQTAGIGKIHVRMDPPQSDLGFDESGFCIFEPMWERYREAISREAVYQYAHYSEPKLPQRDTYNATNRPVGLPREQMYDDLVVARCISFVERHKTRPFFLWAGLEKPHPELYAPAEFHARYAPKHMPLPPTCHQLPQPDNNLPRTLTGWAKQFDGYSDDHIRGVLAAYYANVTYLDDNIGRLLAALDSLGLTDNTIIVYTSDHGDNLFDHGLLHKHCFYEGSVGVPLIIAWPAKLPVDQRRNQIVSLIDLFPTLTSLVGISTPPGLEGRSLTSVLTAPGSPVEDCSVFSEFYSWGAPERMLRFDQYKFVETVNEHSQLYDLTQDPHELNNLAGEVHCRELVATLRHRVRAGWELPPPDYPCRPMFERGVCHPDCGA